MKEFYKRSIYFLIYFLAFTIVLNSGYLLIIARTDWSFSKRIESLTWKDPDFELLVLGTSLAQYGVDTELLTKKGIKSFNLGLEGSNIRTSYTQLEEYLTKYTIRPNYVIFFFNSQLEDIIADGGGGYHPIVEFTMKGQKIDFKDIPISKFQWQTTEIIKKLISSQYRTGYVSFGQVRSFKVVPDNSEFGDIKLNIRNFESAVHIAKIAELCCNNDIEFVIIEIPTVKKFQNQSPVGPYELSFDNGYSAMFYNLNSKEFCSFIDSQNDWGGLSHFNAEGAAKFTMELFYIIQSIDSVQNTNYHQSD